MSWTVANKCIYLLTTCSTPRLAYALAFSSWTRLKVTVQLLKAASWLRWWCEHGTWLFIAFFIAVSGSLTESPQLGVFKHTSSCGTINRLISVGDLLWPKQRTQHSNHRWSKHFCLAQLTIAPWNHELSRSLVTLSLWKARGLTKHNHSPLKSIMPKMIYDHMIVTTAYNYDANDWLSFCNVAWLKSFSKN